MKCLITGATGFVGGHLADHLCRQGHEVVGLSRSPAASRVTHSGIEFPIVGVDSLDRQAMEQALRSIKPDRIFHLAGYANAGKSFSEPQAAWLGNLEVTRTLYDAMGSTGCRARVLFVSTGMVYGDSSKEFPVCTEFQPLRPASPYAASKAAADLLSYQHTRHPGLDIVVARPFNHIGPGQNTDYAASNFARQLAAIEAGKHLPTILTGSLDSKRDFTDVRDMVRAYALLVERGTTGEAYNGGTGRTFVLREILERLRHLSGLNVQINEQRDPNRTVDTAINRVENAKLVAATGWQPEFDIDATLTDLLNEWRNRVAAS